MWQAENVYSLKGCYDCMKAFEAKHGPRWRPSAALERAVKAGVTSISDVIKKA